MILRTGRQARRPQTAGGSPKATLSDTGAEIDDATDEAPPELDPGKAENPHAATDDAATDDAHPTGDCNTESSADIVSSGRGRSWSRLVAYGLLPTVGLLMAMGVGFLKWQDSSARAVDQARAESVRAASEGAVALLSYRPETVEQDLDAAAERMTDGFAESYRELTRDVVIPGSKQKQISAKATVPAAASVSTTGAHAMVLVFVNQLITVGDKSPSETSATVRVALDKVNGRWLIDKFEPV